MCRESNISLQYKFSHSFCSHAWKIKRVFVVSRVYLVDEQHPYRPNAKSSSCLKQNKCISGDHRICHSTPQHSPFFTRFFVCFFFKFVQFCSEPAAMSHFLLYLYVRPQSKISIKFHHFSFCVCITIGVCAHFFFNLFHLFVSFEIIIGMQNAKIETKWNQNGIKWK